RLLLRLADVDHHRLARGIPRLLRPRVAQPVLLADPAGALEEDLALRLALGDEYAVEADVHHDHAVGQVLHVEADRAVELFPPRAQPRGRGLARHERDLRG